MSKPTKRVKATISIKYQVTENKAEFINSVISMTVKALEVQSYPNEAVNPTKGDFITISISEPKPVKAK